MLIREAIELGYPLRMLRLSIESYRIRRVLRIGSVLSASATARRGITAGSGLAVYEMRLVMICISDRAARVFVGVLVATWNDRRILNVVTCLVVR